jgi:hypothetical protein
MPYIEIIFINIILILIITKSYHLYCYVLVKKTKYRNFYLLLLNLVFNNFNKINCNLHDLIKHAHTKT